MIGRFANPFACLTIVHRFYSCAVQPRLDILGIHNHVDPGSPVLFHHTNGIPYGDVDMTLVDDTVFMVPLRQPLEFPNISRVFGSAIMPNLKAGKTAILPIIIATGTQDGLRNIFFAQQSKCSFRDGRGHELHCTMNYKHLGSHNDYKQLAQMETTYRIVQCNIA